MNNLTRGLIVGLPFALVVWAALFGLLALAVLVMGG